MAPTDKQELVIVRRGELEEESVKGGVWKIAHADFMTAMMAFFLVMWLISTADKHTRATIASYFNPVQLAERTVNKKGLEEPKDTPSDPLDSGKGGEKGTKESGNPDGTGGKSNGSGEGYGGKSYQRQKPRFNEGALFQDPYAVLAKIAAEVEATPQDTLGADATPGDNEVPGLKSGEAYRDPFDPLYWQVAPVTELTDKAPKPGTAAPVPARKAIDALAPAGQKGTPVVAKDKAVSNLAAAENAAAKPMPQSGETAEASASQGLAARPQPDVDAAAADRQAADQKAAELKREIARAVELPKDKSPQPHIEVRRTGAGTLISLTDDFDFSMFSVGSAEPQAKVVRAMEKIAKILQSRPGRIVIRGHTDSRPFKSENYDNWRLSQARAQMALYMLVRGGLAESRILRVEGYADRDPKIPEDPKADQNRRIEILLQEQ